MPTFERKSEKFELFDDLLQTSLEVHNQLTEKDKTRYFHSLMRGDALKISKTSLAQQREFGKNPVRPVVNQTILQKNVTLEQTQLMNPVPGAGGRKDRIKSNKEMPQTVQM